MSETNGKVRVGPARWEDRSNRRQKINRGIDRPWRGGVKDLSKGEKKQRELGHPPERSKEKRGVIRAQFNKDVEVQGGVGTIDPRGKRRRNP